MVVAAARSQFFKYGYRKVAMQDIAKAASISRPALYLLFRKKEDVFSAVVLDLARELSDEAKKAMSEATTPSEKLKSVLYVWAIRDFDIYCESSEARELHDASQEFTPDALKRSTSMLKADLIAALRQVPANMLPKSLSNKRVANLLASSLPGFKRVCKSSSELNRMVDDMLTLTLRP